MVFVKAALTTLVLLGGCLTAADYALAQSTGSAPTSTTADTGLRARKGLQAQAPAPAQVQPQTPAAAPATTAAPVSKSTRGPDQEYKECLNLWDAATHMTRAEWAATCRRIQNRLNDLTTQAAQVNAQARRRAR